jgi:hypothetical protein
MRNINEPISFINGSAIWRLHGTHGLTVDTSLELLWEDHSMLPTWGNLIDAAAKDGINIDRFIDRLVFLSGNIYEEPYRTQIIDGLIVFKKDRECPTSS